MQNKDIERAITQLSELYKEKLDPKSSLCSIYLYGSYIRGDFIPGKSDLNFAVFLDVPPNDRLHNHPDLSFLNMISENIMGTLPNSLLKSGSLNKFVFVVNSVNELRQIVKYSENNEIVTFFAFDFFKNHKLLWGKDILAGIAISDPLKFKDQRYELIKKNYFLKKEKKAHTTQSLLTTVSQILTYLAVLDGIRDISKEQLRDWAENHVYFTETQSFKNVLDQYFMNIFLVHLEKQSPINDDWKKRAEQFIEEILK